MKRFLNHQFVRFVLIGGLNTGVSYGLYAGFLSLGLHYALANLLALLLSILFSFRTQGAFVFRNTDARLLWRFGLAWSAIFLFNLGVIRLLIHLGMNAYVAGALALAPVTVLSYFVQKLVVFGAPRHGPVESSAPTSS
jgi:putative flippase GtrA